MHSQTEENYLKVIYTLTNKHGRGASTNEIAERLSTKASSVTDMLKKLGEKKLIHYKKYQGSSLTSKGESLALNIIRKHRLWEVFLFEKLNFKWDEVHILAEQLEHIQSPELTKRLDDFLGNPQYDPHGDPIPDVNGKIRQNEQKKVLSELPTGAKGVIIGVVDSSPEFLRFLEHQKITLGTKLEIKELFEYDRSMLIVTGEQKEVTFSHQICKNIWVKYDQ